MELYRGDREQILFDRDMAIQNRNFAVDDLEFARLERETYRGNDTTDYEMLRAMKEERDAYDDFIASLDMND